MREGIKTSLVSLICVMAVSGTAFAAASVRSIGGANTYTSAANAATAATATNSGTASRSGSLRATGGFTRPTVTTGSSLTKAATPTASTAATTTAGRAATQPRLSIGKYVGAPKTAVSTSNPSSELVQRLEQVEAEVVKLETDKQDALQDSTYITVQDNELILDVEKIKEDLDIHASKDGREVEVGTNETALLWRYVGDNEWTELITWDELKSNIDFGDINQSIATINQQITNLNADLSGKVDIAQGIDKAGKALIVDAAGNVVAAGEFAASGDVYNKTQVYNKAEINQQIAGVEMDLSGKVDVAQGAQNAGKVLIVGDDGNVVVDELDINLSGKVDVTQGTQNAGKALVVGDDGRVAPTSIATLEGFGDLAFKNTVSNSDVDDGTLERVKMAASITDTLAWIDAWRNSMPDDGERYVFAIDENGDAGWFKVAE